MLTYNDKRDNINIREYHMSEDEVKRERYGYTRYIIDCMLSAFKDSNDIASLAIIYLHYFFTKNPFYYYNKRRMACAAIIIAFKTENHNGFTSNLVRYFIKKENDLLKTTESLDKASEVTEKITIYEMILLKALKFNTRFILPSEYIYLYCNLLLPEDLIDSISSTALKVESDSYFTLVNNLYHPYIVAIACISISQELHGLESNIISDSYKVNNKMKIFYLGILKKIHDGNYNKLSSITAFSQEEFNLNFLNYDDKSFSEYNSLYLSDKLTIKIKNETYGENWYNSLVWYKKFHPFIEDNDIQSAILLILEYYDDMKTMLNN